MSRERKREKKERKERKERAEEECKLWRKINTERARKEKQTGRQTERTRKKKKEEEEEEKELTLHFKVITTLSTSPTFTLPPSLSSTASLFPLIATSLALLIAVSLEEEVRRCVVWVWRRVVSWVCVEVRVVFRERLECSRERSVPVRSVRERRERRGSGMGEGGGVGRSEGRGSSVGEEFMVVGRSGSSSSEENGPVPPPPFSSLPLPSGSSPNSASGEPASSCLAVWVLV